MVMYIYTENNVLGNRQNDRIPICGSGSDGSLSVTSGSYELPTTTNGALKYFSFDNLYVANGATLTVSNKCMGIVLLVKNILTLDGTISMTTKGGTSATLTGSDTISPIRYVGLYERLAHTDILDSGFYYFVLTHSTNYLASGGARVRVFNPTQPSVMQEHGMVGQNGYLIGMCGGGGSGSAIDSLGSIGAGFTVSGKGASGTFFGGGSGGGGGSTTSGGTAATEYGSGATSNGGAATSGGVIAIFANKMVCSQNSAVVSNGTASTLFGTNGSSSGGGSGGGSIIIRTIKKSNAPTTLTCDGGVAVTGYGSAKGGNGGKGNISIYV